ncbi:hypothetical protein [Bartonella elizabethae]|uniref:hypothetical protein n=1 Tax=Bartonella elizabethae TaxID=807 RepID=UPI0002DF38FF|nr:hypothetical protein [Bartonella elizabethae]
MERRGFDPFTHVFFSYAFKQASGTTGVRASRERPNRSIIALIAHCGNSMVVWGLGIRFWGWDAVML